MASVLGSVGVLGCWGVGLLRKAPQFLVSLICLLLQEARQMSLVPGSGDRVWASGLKDSG